MCAAERGIASGSVGSWRPSTSPTGSTGRSGVKEGMPSLRATCPRPRRHLQGWRVATVGPVAQQCPQPCKEVPAGCRGRGRVRAVDAREDAQHVEDGRGRHAQVAGPATRPQVGVTEGRGKKTKLAKKKRRWSSAWRRRRISQSRRRQATLLGLLCRLGGVGGFCSVTTSPGKCPYYK